MKILVATDGSQDAANALDFTLRFPFPRDSSISVMTVASDIPMLPEELDALDEAQRQQLDQANRTLLADAEELVQQSSARLQANGWSGEALVRNGNTVDEILKTAEETDADLIVLGSHGTGLARRFLLGSVADRVLESAKCSVMIVRQPPADANAAPVEPGSNAPLKIMLAYDRSDVSREVIDLCAALPLEPDSEIDVVNVMPLVTAYRQDIRQHINEIWQRKRQVMQRELEKSVAAKQWATPNVKTHLREADSVGDEILDAAEQAASDLIMFGCKDRGAIKNLLLGSISRRIARYANSTVWAVRKKRPAA
jgi:nucleotide-binding universal stress UspA family protein